MDTSSGAVRAGVGVGAQTWNILDQVYIPMAVTEASFTWHAMFPAGSFVPRHVHLKQDEYIYILEGELEFVLGDEELKAGPGDMVTLPINIPHSIHNRSGQPVKAIFSVAPTDRIYEYFQKINNMTDKDVMAKLAADHDLPFV